MQMKTVAGASGTDMEPGNASLPTAAGSESDERVTGSSLNSSANSSVRSSTNSALKPAPEPYSGPTYHGQPAIKSSPYGWLVWSYIYVAGLSGGAHIISTLANLVRRPQLHSVVRNGRYLAVSGSAVGAVLLIADLHTPQRWYNMLRIFRRTSPMSIGSYILTTFGLSSAVTAFSSAAAQLLGFKQPGWMRRAEAIAEVPAALAGAGMCSYTGALLSSTSTPMWASSPRLLTARFASSAIATAAAALSLAEQLWGDRGKGGNGGNSVGNSNSRSLDRLACLATAADAGLSVVANRRYREQGVASSLQESGSQASQYKLATGAAHVLPLLCYGLSNVMPRQSRKLSIAAGLGVLAGGLLMRATILQAGNTSANRPQDYFSFTQAEQTGEAGSPTGQQLKGGHPDGRAIN